MGNVPGEDRAGPLGGVLQRMGRTLLCFAGEERRLDSDATFEAWAAAGDTCWKDTEQQRRPTGLSGLPEGATPVVGDGAFVQPPPDATAEAESGFAPPTGWDEPISEFHSEIDHWCQRRGAGPRR
jgi:hypothetical protein